MDYLESLAAAAAAPPAPTAPPAPMAPNPVQAFAVPAVAPANPPPVNVIFQPPAPPPPPPAVVVPAVAPLPVDFPPLQREKRRYEGYTRDGLRQLLRDRGLMSTGLKDDLVVRLVMQDRRNGIA